MRTSPTPTAGRSRSASSSLDGAVSRRAFILQRLLKRCHPAWPRHALGSTAGYALVMPSHQLIPARDLTPPSIRHLSPEDRIRLWAQIVDEGDQMLLSGFRTHTDSDELARQAFLAWLDRRNVENLAAKFRMLKRLHTEQTDGK